LTEKLTETETEMNFKTEISLVHTQQMHIKYRENANAQQIHSELVSTGYSALPLPLRLMRQTHTHARTQYDRRTPSNTIPSPLAKRQRR